jgi:hypothetical protein
MRALALLVVAGCTDLGGAPPDGVLPPDAGAQDGVLCDAEIGHVPLDAASDGVSFREEVGPIFSRKCDFGGCHAAQSPALGLVLAEGAAWKKLVCVRAVGAPGRNRVEKRAPQRSYLLDKLMGTQIDAGGSGRQMPLGREPLTPIEMGWITDWIRGGAKDN